MLKTIFEAYKNKVFSFFLEVICYFWKNVFFIFLCFKICFPIDNHSKRWNVFFDLPIITHAKFDMLYTFFKLKYYVLLLILNDIHFSYSNKEIIPLKMSACSDEPSLSLSLNFLLFSFASPTFLVFHEVATLTSKVNTTIQKLKLLRIM